MHELGDPSQCLVKDCLVQRLLRGEVIEDRRLVRMRRVRNILDRNAGEPALSKQLRRRFQDRSAAFGSRLRRLLTDRTGLCHHKVSLPAEGHLVKRDTPQMAINITETFQVRAPIEAVWRFMLDPHKVAACMPGAELEEVVDGNTFLGSIKVKVGAITSSYKGRVQFTEVDEPGYTVQMVAEGRETGGGTAKGTLSSRLRSLPDGQTEVVAQASVDLTGRIVQVGRGMIQGVSHELFQQFAARAKERLEAPPGVEDQSAVAQESDPIRIVPLLLRVLWSAITRFFRRLLRRPFS